jgi:hypothetical protein
MCGKCCKVLLIALFALGVVWFVVDYRNPLTPMPTAEDWVSGVTLTACLVLIIMSFKPPIFYEGGDLYSHPFIQLRRALVNQTFRAYCCLLN